MALDIKPDTSNDENDVSVNETEPQYLSSGLVPEPEPLTTSPLGDIKGKRAEFLGKMHKDILVPRWNPQNGLPYLFVRIRPISQIELFNAIKKRRDEYDRQVANHETPPEIVPEDGYLPLAPNRVAEELRRLD